MEQTADRPVRPGGSPVAPDPPTAPDATAALTLAGDAASTGAPDTPANAAVRPEGQAPATPSPDTSTLHAWHFQPDREPTPAPLAAVPTLVRDDANFVWLDLDGYGEPQQAAVAETLALDPLAVTATLAPWHRPRLVAHPAHTYVSVTVALLDPAGRRVEARQLDLFVGRNFLVSAHKLPLPFAEGVRSRAWHNPALIRLDAAYLLYVILDELLGYLEQLTEHLGDEIEAMEERALHDPADDLLADLLGLKRYVFAVSRLVEQHRAVFAAFIRPDWQFGTDEVRPYYETLQARLERLEDLLGAAKEGVNGAFDIFVSHMAHRTNAVMRLLTVVSTILLPATLIVGVFGTSFDELPLFRPAGFGIMLALLALSTTLGLLAFRRLHWL